MSHKRVDDISKLKIQLLPNSAIVRTDVIGDGSCFLHAIVYGMSPRDYNQLTLEQRMEVVSNLRIKLANDLTFETWLSLPAATLSVQIGVRNLIDEVLGKGITNAFKQYPALSEWYEKNKKPLVVSKSQINEGLGKALDGTVFSFANSIGQLLQFPELGNQIVDSISREEYKKFKGKLADTTEYIENDTFKYIADRLGVLVIFINENGTLYKYPITREELRRYKKAVLVYYIEDTHFQSIAIIRNRILTRLFDIDDEEIQPLINAME